MYKKEHYKIKQLKYLLSNGLYIFYNNQIFKAPFNVHFFAKRFFVWSKFKIDSNTNLFFQNQGCKKQMVVKGSNYTYCFYKDKESFLEAKSSYDKYAHLINYPLAKIFGFYEKNLCCKMETIYGYESSPHNRETIFNYLIGYAANSKVIHQEGWYYSLQHGDVKDQNIIFESENNFRFIDLDSIGPKPIFYDVVEYLVLTNYPFDKFLELLKNNKSSLIICLKNIGLDYDYSTLDIVLLKCCMLFSKKACAYFINNEIKAPIVKTLSYVVSKNCDDLM